MRANTLDDAALAYAGPIRARPKGVRAAQGPAPEERQIPGGQP